MGSPEFHHSEAFLQWVWENLLFDFSSLETTNHKKIHLLNPGSLNTSDGPDFKQATLEIDGLTWHGDIEIHTQSKHWNAHRHHEDPNFDSVVLHVVTEAEPTIVSTENGSTPFTLNLLPYLSKELHQFLRSFSQPSELPCSSGLNFISEKAFTQQIDKAHEEYFEKKSDDFLQFYDPNLTPSKAWRQALIISLWDGLGISHNREAMQQTGISLLQSWDGSSVDSGIQQAYKIAGFSNLDSTISWNLKSVRSANHPKNRIQEAVQLTALILQQPFKNFLTQDAPIIWENWVFETELTTSSRMQILFGTVFLPSLYMLGKLFAFHALSQSSLSAWKQLKTPIPKTLLKKFDSLNLSNDGYSQKLGAVHQLKTYCKPARCSECFVLKKAIQS